MPSRCLSWEAEMSTAEADVKPASTESEMKRTWACHQCPSEAISAHQKPSKAIRGQQRGHQSAIRVPSEAIRGHQRPSEAIRGHQRPSEAIRGHLRVRIRGHLRVREVAYKTAQMEGSHQAVRDPDEQ